MIIIFYPVFFALILSCINTSVADIIENIIQKLCTISINESVIIISEWSCKHCGTRRNYSLWAISIFSTMFSNCICKWQRVIILDISTATNVLEHSRKRRNPLNEQYSSFSLLFPVGSICQYVQFLPRLNKN